MSLLRELLRVGANVEDVVSSNENASVICHDTRIAHLSSLLKDNIHVVIAADHLPAIFIIILELHCDVAI